MKGFVQRRAIPLIFIVSSIFAFSQDRGLNVIARQVTGKADFDIGKQYAVIIGIDRYKEWPVLRSAVSEAKSLRKVLSSRYYIDEFFELYDSDGTASNIRHLFVDTLPQKLTEKDSLLIFYSGHGQLDATGTGFWIASDGSKDAYAQNNWIANAQLRNMMGRLKAQRILILADSCFSGDFVNVSRGTTPTIDSAFYQKALQLTARQVLTSGASEAVPDESEFGRQLINALQRNEEPLIDPFTLYDRIRKGVTKTLPLYGTLTGNEDGASFVLFLKKEGDNQASTSSPAITVASIPTGKADLMVKASEEGAEILVNGVSMGKAPLLLQSLPSDTALKVEVRTEGLAGAADLMLKKGELREVPIVMTPRLGNLLISSNERDVRVCLDDQDKGPLGSGILHDIPVGVHSIKLSGQDLLYESEVKVIPDATTQVKAVVQAIGSIELRLPPEVPFQLINGKTVLEGTGGTTLSSIPIGSWEIQAGGGDWLTASTLISLNKGQKGVWEPWKGGTIAFSIDKPDAICSLSNGAIFPIANPPTEIPEGEYTATIQRDGYFEKVVPVSVTVGKVTLVSARLERLEPASIVMSHYASGINALIGEAEYKGHLDKDGNWIIEGIPAGLMQTIRYQSSIAESLFIPDDNAVYGSGETVNKEIPLGQFRIPWVPEGTVVQVGGQTITPELKLIWKSPLLPFGKYKVTATGKYPYSGIVNISSTDEIELPNYRNVVSGEIKTDRDAIQKKLNLSKGLKLAGWVTLGTGAASLVSGAVSYFLGNSYMQDYLSSNNPDSTLSARNKVDTSQTVFWGSVGVASASALLTPLFFFLSPKTQTLEASIQSLNDQISRLK